MYEHIAAGTDLSATAKIATDRAAWLAERLSAKLTLVHAGPTSEELEEVARSYGADVVTEGGSPADVLVEVTERVGADLLVVGSVGMSGPRRFMLGNVPNKVSHHAPSDLLIVKTDARAERPPDYQRVLVGTDGSPTATKAVEMAASLASKLGSKTVIVCAYEPPTKAELDRMRADPNDPVDQWGAGKKVAQTPPEFRWRIAGASQAEDVLERAEDHARKMGIDAEVRAIEGSPAETLIGLAESERFDVIAVGSVGMSGAKRFSLGNVPHRVSHHAPTDVLILRTM